MEEQLLRAGRRGREIRPFCQAAGVTHRGYSRRLQRVLVDFGAEGAFAPAARRVQEHYGFAVPVSAVRQWTLWHGQAVAAVATKVKAPPAARTLITEMDGSMVPVVQPGGGSDRRKGKTVLWREARLCCARSVEHVAAVYGATLGSPAVAGEVWAHTARLAGLGERTRVHGVGDGANWISNQFAEHFGQQGTYLIDFYHVSEYLAAAAAEVALPGKELHWRRRQQGLLLNNRSTTVLRHLANTPAASAARQAWQYLSDRRTHLDYAGARKQNLPIGSGEIESGHRHVIQHRLKIAGGWWTERNLEAMLQLRTARANNWWSTYWSNHHN